MKRNYSKKGVKVQTEFYGKEVAEAVADASTMPLKKCAVAVMREAKLSMRTGGGLDRTPSDPGTPPNVQSGTLRASVNFALDSAAGIGGRRTVAVVGPTRNAWYGKIHEYGGKVHPERPFMAPALEAARTNFAHLFKNMRLDKTPAGKKLNNKKFDTK